jgi:hypothetical protein
VSAGKKTRKAQHGRMAAGVLAMAALVSLSGCQGLSLFGLFDTENPGPFSFSPSRVVLRTDDTISLRTLGGFGAYSYDYVLDGTFDELTGQYKAPGSVSPPEPLIESITALDELGNVSETIIEVYSWVAPLAVTPSSWTATVGDVGLFAISDGRPPYERSLDGELPVSLAVDQTTVDTTALAAGEHRLEITDAMHTLVVVTITVIPAGVLGIDPASATVAPGGTVQFAALNASTPLFSVQSGLGTISSTGLNTAEYQAPGAGTSTAVILLEDGSRSVTATVYVVDEPALVISPAYSELLLEETLELTASGGVPPYTFVLAAGRGTLQQSESGNSALYTAPPDLPTRAQVTLLDSVGSLPVNAVLKVSKPK